MGSVFHICADEMVEISPGATVACSVVHVPITCDKLCFVNAKAGLGLSFNIFKQSNKDGVINSLRITNKSELPITVQRGQQVGSLHLVETVNIPGNVSNSSLSSSFTFKFFE